MNKLKLMVVGAHGADPFDLAGGTMANYVRDGHEVMVVALSLGAKSHAMKATGIEELRQIKLNELELASKKLGVQHLRSLGYEEDPLVFTRKEYRDMVNIIREFRPDIVISHHLSADAIPDHVETGKFVKHACHCAGRPGFESDLPVFVVRNQYTYGLAIAERGQLLLGAPPALPSVYVDVTETVDQKFESLKQFVSQQYTPELLQKRKEAFEGHYGVNLGTDYAEPFYSLKPLLVNELPLFGGVDNFGRNVEGTGNKQ